jgi:hypothetical protein
VTTVPIEKIQKKWILYIVISLHISELYLQWVLFVLFQWCSWSLSILMMFDVNVNEPAGYVQHRWLCISWNLLLRFVYFLVNGYYIQSW